MLLNQPMNSQQLHLLLPEKLNSCTSITQLQQIHAAAIKTTSLHLQKQLLYPKLISLSSISSSSHDLFYVRSIVLQQYDNTQFCLNLCNAILQNITSNCNNKSSSYTYLNAMIFFREILLMGLVPDEYTVPCVLKALAQFQAIREGQQIHAHSIKSGLLRFNVYVTNTLMRLYGVCGFFHSVHKLFDECPQRDLVSWTTLIQAFVKAGLYSEAMKVFLEMRDLNLRADGRTLVVVLSACANLGDLNLGRKVHSYIRDYIDVNADVFLGNALIAVYLKCNDSSAAYKVFDEMPLRNVVTWNSMISGLTYQGQCMEALDIFWNMQRTGPEPDEVTLVGVLNSCANLGLLESGKWVHAYISKNRIRVNEFIGNALVDMYAKCGRIDEAFRVFTSMKRRDVYSYTAMIMGLALHGEAQMAFHVFYEMLRARIEPNEVTFLGLLMTCSHAGLVLEGKKIFSEMSNKYKLNPQTEHYGCMVDLFGRAGLLKEAEEIIHSMEIRADAFSWGALLGACRIHGNVGLGEKVMQQLMDFDGDEDGIYILMTNLYSSAKRWKDALRLRKAMKNKKIRKAPGCSLIELGGIVHEFRRGDESQPNNKVICTVLEGIASHFKSFRSSEHEIEE